MDILKKNKRELAIILFCIAALAVVLASVFWLRTPVVSACVLVILETALAATLHRMELWIHVALVIIELIAGTLFDRLALAALCVLVYIAATVTLQFMVKKER